MPTPLSFTVLSERPAGIPGNDRGRSVSAVEVVLSRSGVIDRPVDLARVLKRYGLTLSQAHAALNALVDDTATHVTLTGSREAAVTDLAPFGVLVHAA